MIRSKTKKLIIFGDSAFAEIAYEYFTYDSEYEVCGFTVSKEYLQETEKFGLPVVPFETVESQFPSARYEMHIALVYNTLNRVRKRFYVEAKLKNYTLANYISSKAFVWKNVKMGDNIFIFENNVVQPFTELGSNIVLWSGNHIGHHSKVQSHCFISSHVVISGFCSIGECCFMGVNSTVANNVIIGDDCLVGSGAMVVKSLPAGSLLKGPMTKPDEQTTYQKFNMQ